ncbi:MAG TPA: preprotein translocase subunit YajC [Actinomycetota bacterium]|nr:preprotein translocase subunit YajC [Actinomycetota bacterium]
MTLPTGLLLAATKSSSSGASYLIFLGALLVVFYLLLVRPQRRRLRQHQDLVSTLEPGDEVVTIGGIIGYIQGIDEDAVRLDIADGCTIRVVKQAIARKVEDEPSLTSREGTTTGEGHDGGTGLEGSGEPDDTE